MADSNAMLNDVITAAMNGEFAEAAASLEELRAWRDGGGAAPSDPRGHGRQRPGVDWLRPVEPRSGGLSAP